MKSIFTLLILFCSASAFAVPCEEATISQALHDYINKQPMCINPCESAKIERDFYLYGMELIKENCPVDSANVLVVKNHLDELGRESQAAVEAACP